MKELICKECGYVGHSIKITKGSMGMELLLWLVFLIPGLFYSIWRITSRYNGCPQCRSESMIPILSPVGQKLVAEQSRSDITPSTTPPVKKINTEVRDLASSYINKMTPKRR